MPVGKRQKFGLQTYLGDGATKAAAVDIRKSEPWETTHSGNSVSLEQELINAGDVNRAYRLNTGIAKAFHRMLLASAKA